MLLRHAFALASLITLAPCTASAVQYETFIEVSTEQDLYDLLATEQISESSFNALLLLYQTRVELNRADRQQLYLLPNLDYRHVDRFLAYRAEVGTIHELDDLVAAGVLEADLVKTLRPFVIVRPLDVFEPRSTAFLRVQSRWSGRYDRIPPASAVQARIKALRNLDVGVSATLTRNGLRRVRWDVERSAPSPSTFVSSYRSST